MKDFAGGRTHKGKHSPSPLELRELYEEDIRVKGSVSMELAEKLLDGIDIREAILSEKEKKTKSDQTSN